MTASLNPQTAASVFTDQAHESIGLASDSRTQGSAESTAQIPVASGSSVESFDQAVVMMLLAVMQLANSMQVLVPEAKSAFVNESLADELVENTTSWGSLQGITATEKEQTGGSNRFVNIEYGVTNGVLWDSDYMQTVLDSCVAGANSVAATSQGTLSQISEALQDVKSLFEGLSEMVSLLSMNFSEQQ